MLPCVFQSRVCACLEGVERIFVGLVDHDLDTVESDEGICSHGSSLKVYDRVQVELREAYLASWVQRFRRKTKDPRDVLLAAMTDFSNSALASRAVAFYDNPQQFEAFLDNCEPRGTLGRVCACTNASGACLRDILCHCCSRTTTSGML